jgi:hypothetical protein
MLNEFLVLGQVPGTNFQVTFNELAILFDATLLFFVLERYHHLINKVRYYWLYTHLLIAVRKGQQLSLPV